MNTAPQAGKHCDAHSGQCARMDRAEQDIQTIFKEIKGMKNWVIAGMGGLIVEVVIFVGSIVLKHHGG